MAMICVDGPAVLSVGTISCDAAPQACPTGKELGITESGVQISIGGQAHRVMSDDMGGSEGMPAELLYMGSTASIRGVLVKYETDALATLATGISYSGIAEGKVLLPGTPLFAGSYGFSLIINGASRSFYFPKCELISQPREFNISSTERKTSFTVTAYPVFDNCQGGLGYLYAVYTNTQTKCPDQCSKGYGGSRSYTAATSTSTT